jgi:asparagine synthase (glutamine-hydrolysing)
MIFGSFSLSAGLVPAIEEIIASARQKGLSFHPVCTPGFSGGCLINPRLPHTINEVIYTDPDNDIIVLFSGSVYNRSEVQDFIGDSTPVPDPELITRLFVRCGPGFVKSLNGDFAICIIRPGAGKLFLFRDHIGIIPLAWRADSGSLSFSTDITGLCRAVSGGRDINTTWLTGHFRYIDYRLTPCETVKKLLPGHYLEFSGSGLKTVRYWNPGAIKPDKSLTYGQVIRDLEIIVRDAVRIRCDNRYTAAAHVSGGLDSGIVAVIAREEYAHQKEFLGLSWSPSDHEAVDGRQDERELVEKTCGPAAIRLVLSDIDRHSFPGVVSSYYDNHGYFSEYYTAGQAVERGVNLIFSGWGGDEFVSTGAAAMEPDLIRSLHWRLYLQRNSIRHPKLFMYNFSRYVLYPALGILDRNTARSFRDDARYLKKGYRKSDRSAIRRFYFNTTRRSHHIGMLDFYHLQERCESWYEMGFRKGLEYRYPLLDRRIIEYMIKVPSVLLCTAGQSRPILRELGKGILHDDVRLGSSKSDPVYWSFMKDLYREASHSFMEEIPLWRENHDLEFIDFDLLARDISGHRSGSDIVSEEVLFRSLVYLKALHGFTKKYHEISNG